MTVPLQGETRKAIFLNHASAMTILNDSVNAMQATMTYDLSRTVVT
jgi:hypothetical protein